MSLTELEQEQLQVLLNNEVLLRIVQKAFDSAIEVQKPKIGLLDSNKLLGEKYRGYELSKTIISDAFTLLLAHKIEKIGTNKLNRAR